MSSSTSHILCSNAITIYSLFLEHDMAKSAAGIVSSTPPVCPCVDVRKDNNTPSGKHLKMINHETITQRKVEDFRRRMASLRLVPAPNGCCTRQRNLPDLYISPVVEVFRLDVFRGCGQKFHIWYDKEMGVPQKGMSTATVWYSPTAADASTSKQALLHVLFVPPELICWEDAADEAQSLCVKNAWLLHYAQLACEQTQYVLVTDEQRAIIFNGFDSQRIPGHISIYSEYMCLGPVLSLRCIVGAAVEQAIPGFDFTQNVICELRYLRGALYDFSTAVKSDPEVHSHNSKSPQTTKTTARPPNSDDSVIHVLPSGGSAVAVNLTPQRFRDFDLYSLQRHKHVLSAFLSWKPGAEKRALASPIQRLDSLTVHVDAFINRHPLLKFNLPLEKPPRESLELITDHPRPRDDAVDSILALARRPDACGALRVHVEDVIQSGAKRFSQVVSGRLEWTDNNGTVSQSQTKLCLKLFDEALFEFPLESVDQEFARPAQDRLEGVCFADDLIRNEHLAYERLQYLQGSVLAHCYGYHEFVLPDGRAVYGIIMEMVQGQLLSSLPWFHEWPEHARRALVRRLRHAVRALVYGGIVQQDWHLGQIIVIPRLTPTPPVSAPPDAQSLRLADDPRPDEGVMDGNFDIAFIDFAFSFQRLGEANTPRADIPLIIPQLDDVDMLDFVLLEAGIGDDLFQEEWFGRDDQEY